MNFFGWMTLAVLGAYLARFFWGGMLAAQAAGRPIWLFGAARGRDRLAAIGFRAAFGLALAGPLIWLAVPVLHKADPLWTEGRYPVAGLAGFVVAAAGAVLALAAQKAMGASWRVGVQAGETGALVQGGLFRLSRNPTFLGQLLLLFGGAAAIPALPTALAAVLFFWSACVQIRSEEAALAAANGAAYEAFRRSVPRWIGWPGGAVETTPARLVFLALAALLLDQATKAIALSALAPGQPVPLLPGLALTLGFNEGASFGMLSGLMSGRPLAMVTLTGAITLGMAILAFRSQRPVEAAGLALIVGGSLGNIADRLARGAVTDFIDVFWRNWHWPAFNLADVAISCGAALILFAALPDLRRKRKNA